jgi:hypothetical protein
MLAAVAVRKALLLEAQAIAMLEMLAATLPVQPTTTVLPGSFVLSVAAVRLHAQGDDS